MNQDKEHSEPSKPESNPSNTTHVAKKKSSVAKKKRAVESVYNEFDSALDMSIVLTSEVAFVRRQQLNVLKAMKSHNIELQKVEKEGDGNGQMLIDRILKPKSDMKYHPLDPKFKKKLLTRPAVFQPDGVIDKDSFHFGHTIFTYRSFVEEEERKNNLSDRRKLYTEEMKPFLHMPDLDKCGLRLCSGCGKPMIHCHDVVYGPFCVYRVIKVCEEARDFVCDLVVKKVFLDTYNCCLEFMTFRETKNEPKDEWLFPPLCMQDNSYAYAVFWYEWTVEGMWRVGYPDDKEEEESDY